jgi:flavin reductase (DIM6/NTAB) family NADH-FMN oxidoreductase RutF
MTVDSQAFRAVMGRFATGVAVVTTCEGSQRMGITVNAFCSVSLDPPLVLVCIERTSRLYEALLRSGIFAVNLLRDDQQQLSICFAGTSEERYRDFCSVSSHAEATSAPVFDESLGWADCRVVASYPGGDHTIFVGQVEALGAGTGEPLLYYRSNYLQNPAQEHDEAAAQQSAQGRVP